MQYSEIRPLVVGVLLFDGFEMLDAYGPMEMFGLLGSKVRIVTLAEHTDPVKPRNGPATVIERTLDNAGEIDLLLIPGGSGTRKEVDNPGLIAALKRLSETTPNVASVCTGSALLARTGLLDARRATSNKRALLWASQQGKNVTWIHQARWVEDGKFSTSSGISAGIDLSLALIATFFGRETAIKTAQNAEYVWNQDSTVDPFSALNADTAKPTS